MQYTTRFYTRNGRLAQTAKNLQHLSIQLTLLTERKKKTSDHLNKGRKTILQNEKTIYDFKIKIQVASVWPPSSGATWDSEMTASQCLSQVPGLFHIPPAY